MSMARNAPPRARQDGATSVWIDSDMGFDDLAAILLVVAHRPVAGLSLVAGNSGLDCVIGHAVAAAATFGWGFGLYRGAAAPLQGPLVTAAYVLGPDGMASRGRRLVPPPAPEDALAPQGAVAAMAAYLQAGGRDILALGPLTNLAGLVAAHPELVPAIRLIWMGGAYGAGNHSAVAEFNAAVDPEALAQLIAAGVAITMVGLDPCRQVTAGLADLADLRDAALADDRATQDRATLLADLFEAYLRIADDGARPMALYDPVAAAVLTHPQHFTLTPARLDAETGGQLCRGMTVVEWRARKAAPNALIVTKAQAAPLRALILDALLQGALLWVAGPEGDAPALTPSPNPAPNPYQE